MRNFSFLKFLVFFLAVSLNIHAQVCNGSLGDPAVNIDFGSGNSSPSSYVPVASYTFIGSPCPNDGYYTITNATSGCFGDTWHTLSNDHTGNGNFMLVNASFEAGDFFLTTVTDLCPNTTYEFSSYVLNIMKLYNSITPDLVFYIEQPDGTVLNSFDTGPVPVTGAPQWKKYGLLFTTPANNATVILRIRNNSPGGTGNDLALDDIAFRPCGPTITAAIQGKGDTVNVCEGNTDQYTFAGDASSAYESPVYQWQTSLDEGTTWTDITGATGNSYLRLPTLNVGQYWYRLSVVDAARAGIISCRINSNILIINVHSIPVANAGPDRIYVKGFPVELAGSATGEDLSYNWSPDTYISDPKSLTPTASPPSEMMYKLVVQSAFNCTSEDDVDVKVADGIFVPNAFTPNGDGVNDTWQIPYLDIGLNADVKIFNRWGKLIYHVNAATVSWNGNVNGLPQASGSYIYVITFKENKLPPLKGTILLIR